MADGDKVVCGREGRVESTVTFYSPSQAPSKTKGDIRTLKLERRHIFVVEFVVQPRGAPVSL
jgi:hypothetical protein